MDRGLSTRGDGVLADIKVVALVGPSGTGKSHRASIVAHEMGAAAILDDGLLIADGKILAGRSAKREPSKVAATRRALLDDPVHSAEIRDALARLAPGKLLIIGISPEMISRVAATLGLPAPAEVIRIEQFASPRQMRKARRVRASQGKHVIPAPTLEVSKSFQGYPVDPLRVFIRARRERLERRGKPSPGEFIEKSVVRPTWSSLGRFYIEEVVLAAIAAKAAVEAGGVGRVHAVTATSGEAAVSFKLAVGVVYGCNIPQVVGAVVARVKDVVEHMTGLSCEGIEVQVQSVVPPGGPLARRGGNE
ncbi:MAG: Asp23/Gls24 family envelope stress response protein [Bacillota bacterium]|nr:MAG: Asp23/Gls24 family envelope stress response protein [Bacillota bacterium]